MFFDIEKDVDKGALSEALSDSAEVTVVSLKIKFKKQYTKNIFSKTFYLKILHFSIIFIFQGQWRPRSFGFW